MENPSQAGAALVPVAQALMRLPSPDEPLRDLVHWLDVSTWDGKAQLYNATQGQDAKVAEMIGLPMEVVSFLAHPASSPDPKTGEVQHFARIVLFLADGTRVSCGSEGMLNSLRSLCAAFGYPPWAPPMPITVKEEKGAGMNKYYTLELKTNGKLAPVASKSATTANKK